MSATGRGLPGTQVSAEINLGGRSVLGYLSPVQKVAHEAGRERYEKQDGLVVNEAAAEVEAGVAHRSRAKDARIQSAR